MVKRKSTKKRSTKRERLGVSQVREDTKQRRKYRKGGRIEAYTFGEALGSKNWP